ncbi:MAG: germination protein YpeB, partial [Clostridia bacterium]|nr:germination protein YpeB [Clostridia bacterium]
IADSVSLVSENKMNIRKVTSEKPYSFRSSDKISHTPVQYPELIYDGPFSDGRDVEEYRYFENEPAISLKDAKEIAKAALPDLGVKTVTSAGKSEKEPLYELMISGERGDAYVSVSERGGKIINLSVWRDLG